LVIKFIKMNYYIKPTFFVLICIFISCNKEVEKPKVSYTKKSTKTEKPQKDTTKVVVADLPIQFEGTKFLIFPVGLINNFENSSKYESSSRETEPNFNVSNDMDNEITGFLTNLKFQNINNETFTDLTEKPIFLETTTYLKTIANKTKKQILLHQLADSDTNDDGKLDSNDIKSIYLSDISGSNFTKVSTDLHEIINWKIIESQNRLYFKSIEDTNKNGAFDKSDMVHYSYVNLLDKDWKAVEYKVF
jgi:hypothetical protein